MNAAQIKGPPYFAETPRKNGTTVYHFHLTPSKRPKGWPEMAEPWPSDVGRSLTPRLSDDLPRALEQATQLNEALRNLRNKIGPIARATPRKGSIPWLMEETLESSVHEERVNRWSERHRKDTLRGWQWWRQQSAKLAAAKKRIKVEDVQPVDHIPLSDQTWSARTIIKALAQPEVKDKLPTRRAYRAALSSLVKTALIEGVITKSPIEDVPLPVPKSTFYAFSEDEIARLVETAPKVLEANGEAMQRIIVLMSEIGQREGDALRLHYARDYRAGDFRFSQSKTGATLVIPATEYLRQYIGDGDSAIGPIVNWPHSVDHLRHSFRALCRAAGIPDEAKLMHLRHFAIGLLAELGFDAVQIRSITGHSLGTINQMLDGHYLARSSRTARMIVSKMDEYRRNKG